MKNFRATVGGILMVTAMASAVGSCGGGGDGTSGTCGKVAPCGGDILGTWTVKEFCINDSVATFTDSDFCPTGTVDSSGLKVSGTVVYTADRTYKVDTTLSGAMKVILPPACLMDDGVTLTCTQMDQRQKAILAKNPDPDVKSVSCASVGVNCVCTSVMADQISTESGTFTTVGTKVNEKSKDTGETDTKDYCVQGNTLHAIHVDMKMTMAMMGKVVISMDAVATK